MTVREVVAQGLRMSGRGWGHKSPDQYCLKVCGRDEYLEGYVRTKRVLPQTCIVCVVSAGWALTPSQLPPAL